MIITFCGHSNYIGNKEDKERLLKKMEEVFNGKQVDFYLGGYGGFDRFALDCAKIYKEKHGNASLIYVTAYLDARLDDNRENLEREYDGIIYPQIENVPKRFAISKRNEWMVVRADYVFAYVKRHFGGAYNTLLYANKHNKPYFNLYDGEYELY